MATGISSDRKIQVEQAIKAFGLSPEVSGLAYNGEFACAPQGQWIETFDPTTGEVLARVRAASVDDCHTAIEAARAAFAKWRVVPAPQRGEVVRRLGVAFRERKEDLARLISVENGKILSEARGEVQEVIDMCDFAVGLSRQLYGRDIASERPEHRLTGTNIRYATRPPALCSCGDARRQTRVFAQ